MTKNYDKYHEEYELLKKNYIYNIKRDKIIERMHEIRKEILTGDMLYRQLIIKNYKS
jgi:hypothetical protein